MLHARKIFGNVIDQLNDASEEAFRTISSLKFDIYLSSIL